VGGRKPIPVIPDEWTSPTTGAIEVKDRNLTFQSQSSQHCSLSISVCEFTIDSQALFKLCSRAALAQKLS
jgi:hypothetical protein